MIGRGQEGSVSAATGSDVPFIQTIFHPTDFSKESEEAFAHALAVCLFRKGELTILHAGDQYLDGDDWQKFPAVRRTLERWKLLPPGSARAAVFHHLGIRVNKVSAVGDPLAASIDHLVDNPADLMVLATEGREGLPRWIQQSTAERLARDTGIKTLFVPHGARGFVDRAGEITLRRVLVPVAAEPDPHPALVYAARATLLAGGDPVELVALHVGEDAPRPALPEPIGPGCRWRAEQAMGDVEDMIVRFAETHEVDLVIMATRGPDSLAEVLAGSTTEQVLRRSPCPVLAVPQV
jgi:nucleotide-binding universal stress UspA family protein